MKKIVLVTILLIMVTSTCVWADYSFLGGFAVDGANQNVYSGKCTIAGSPYATDKYNLGIDTPLNAIPNEKALYASFYKSNGAEGWDGPNGFYSVDARGMLSVGQVKVEDIYVWASPITPSEDMFFGGGVGSDYPDVICNLKLLSVPNGTTYTGPTEWTTESLITLPYYSSTNGLTGYHFRAEFRAVPEPSSLLALFSGLASVGGMILSNGRQRLKP